MKQKVASVDEQASFFLFLTLHLGMDFEFRRVMDLRPLSVESAALASSSRAASWRRRHAAPQLPAMQTLEVPLDGANMADYRHCLWPDILFTSQAAQCGCVLEEQACPKHSNKGPFKTPSHALDLKLLWISEISKKIHQPIEDLIQIFQTLMLDPWLLIVKGLF